MIEKGEAPHTVLSAMVRRSRVWYGGVHCLRGSALKYGSSLAGWRELDVAPQRCSCERYPMRRCTALELLLRRDDVVFPIVIWF